MYSFYKLTISRVNLPVLALALTTVLIFSSWGKAPRYTSLHELAGASAFKTATSLHSIQLNGRALTYRATMGYVAVNDSDHHQAQLFYSAYTAGAANRPVTFVFNGGPGSSSIWLHMGSFGPVRAVPGKAGYTDNPDTWLGFTDLVFIDPAGTGYSRAEDGTDACRFYGYYEDIRAIGQFIKQYIAENHREQSPLFLAGESYGAARAVGLANYLQDTIHNAVSGLTLISPALDYRLITFGKGNDAPYPYYLPAYAATAQYHHLLAPELQALTTAQLNERVSSFALGAYSQYLKGGKGADHIIDTLNYYTGIDKTALRKLNGRLTDKQFVSVLLQDKAEQTGTYDSRATGHLTAADPSETALRQVFPQAFRQYREQVLQYDNHLPYLATIATPDWNYGPRTRSAYFNVVPLLKEALNRHPDLKVHVVSGTYDLATPAATVDQAVAELNINDGQLLVHHYKAGHMLYTDDKANAQWQKDSQEFYQNTVSARI